MSHNDIPVMHVFTYGPDLPRAIYAAVMGAHRETYDLMLAEADGEWVEGGKRVTVVETEQQHAASLSASCETHITYKGAEAYVGRPTSSPRITYDAGLNNVGGLYDIKQEGKRGNIILANNLTRTEMLATAVELTVALSPQLLRYDLPGLTFMEPMYVNWMAGSDDAIHIPGKGVAWA